MEDPVAKYLRYGTAASLFEAGSGQPFGGHILYVTPTEFGLALADGSTAYFTGTGLVWNEALDKFTAGTITAINHYSGGTFNDSLEGLSLSAASVQLQFEKLAGSDALRLYFYSGNDVLDARDRDGDAVESVTLIGYGGNDTIHGGAGDDLLGGEDGNDVVSGGGGSDKIYGGDGHDSITGGAGLDRVNAGSGNDTMNGGDGDDILHGSAGSDTHIGGAGIDTAEYARSFYDLAITATAAGFTIFEPNGIDTLVSIERIAADEGVFAYNAATKTWNRISDTPGDLLLNPGSARDGTGAAETLDLRTGSAAIARGFGGNDVLIGSFGFDLLLAGAGNDLVFGDFSNFAGNMDRLHGGDGNDTLHGGAGTDMLYGGAGSDRLLGGNGSDTMTGGGQADVFVFVWDGKAGATLTWGNDEITDFTIGSDHLQLAFLNLAPGTPKAPTLTQTADGALITLDGAGSILLKGVDITGYTLGDLLL